MATTRPSLETFGEVSPNGSTLQQSSAILCDTTPSRHIAAEDGRAIVPLRGIQWLKWSGTVSKRLGS